MPTPANHVWKPSCARSVTIDGFVPVPRGSNAAAPPLLNWPTKDPGDTLDYEADISPALVGNEGDSIATIDVAVFPNNPGDLSVNNATADGTRCVFWLAGGQSGTIYTVTIIVGTASGRTIQRSVLVPVLFLSVPAPPPMRSRQTLGLSLRIRMAILYWHRHRSEQTIVTSCSDYAPVSLKAFCYVDINNRFFRSPALICQRLIS
jgi:hypothetical protein